MIKVNEEAFAELQGSVNDSQFAKRLGISRSQYWRIRHGRSGVGVDFIEGFMKCFPNLTVNDYFFALSVATQAHKKPGENRIEHENGESLTLNFFATDVALSAHKDP